MERSRIKLFLVSVCLLALAMAVGIAMHRSSKKKMAPELKTGLKAFTNPDAVVKDLE